MNAFSFMYKDTWKNKYRYLEIKQDSLNCNTKLLKPYQQLFFIFLLLLAFIPPLSLLLSLLPTLSLCSPPSGCT